MYRIFSLFICLNFWIVLGLEAQCWKVVGEFEGLEHLEDVKFLDENIGWILADEGFSFGVDSMVLLHTIDGGITWNVIYKDLLDCCENLIILDENNLVMGVSSKEIYKSNDGGYHWTPIPITDDLLDIDRYANAIDFVTPEIGWVAIKQHGLFHTTDGGESWHRQYLFQEPFLTEVQTFHFIDEQHGWASNAGNGMFRTDDGGAHWELMIQHPESVIYEIEFLNDSIGWAMGHSAEWLYKTTNGGENWELIHIMPDQEHEGIADMHFINNNLGWVSFRWSEKIIMTTDGGLTWNNQSSEFVVPFSSNSLKGSIHMINIDKGFVTDLNNTLRRYRGGLPPCVGVVTNYPLFTWIGLRPYIEWNMPWESTGVCVDGFELRFIDTHQLDGGGWEEIRRIDVGDVNNYQVEEPFEPFRTIVLQVIPYSRVHGKRMDVQPEDCINDLVSVYFTTVACPALPSAIDTFICQGEDFIWDGHVFSEAGTYQIEYRDSLDCDSTITLNLEWEQPVQTIVDTTLVLGGTFNGVAYEEDAIFTELYPAATGCDSIVTYVISIITNTEEPRDHNIWRVFPNPMTADWFYLLGKEKWQEATLYDTNGRQVQTWKGDYAPGRNRLELKSIQSGVYFLVIQNESGVWTERVVLM